ncbi:hypothetical protein SPRG_22175 [Saprolegnia parasitica CBS 223.65]|uniref:Uncharacterized protein n=1 Tax=Saprolegnia parasitica (strain CBS 223.65) TaxID=695850 RepID=A0A067CQN8_SAPPC|nr:hypothetical protein SPRG_22175 [Saprolegnia parasitica CBS 223.65]KDO28841.1 hypothetical protein SPRG_22175 [Saprolegnia parasitica CBS 223.65]|eukprot:XP_012200578.1 hypothetical protein SPRG_22175 [Saprolegnia parasitica CBS 223.65]
MRVRSVLTISMHASGVGDLGVLPGSIAVTCGEDGYVRFTDLTTLKELKAMILDSDDGTIPSLAVGGNDIFVATSDNYVLNRYSVSAGAKPKFEGCFLRCTEDIKHVDCSTSYVGVVSEDTQSRIVYRANMERLLLLNGHKEVAKSIAMDPIETYVATSGADSTVQIFNIANIDDDTVEVTALKSLPLQYQNGMKDDDVLCRIAWAPLDGRFLAVPLRTNTLGLYARDSWALTHKLVFPSTDGIVHADINVVAFSPNGRYVAAASMARQVFVWSVATHECIAVYEVDDAVMALSWLVDANGIALLLASGNVGYAENVAPDACDTAPATLASLALTIAAPTVVVPEVLSAPMPVVPPAFERAVLEDEDEDEDPDMQVNAIKASFGFGQDMTILPAALPVESSSSPAPSPRGASHVSPLVFAKPLAPPFQSGSILSGPVTLLAWSPLGEIERLPSTDDHLIQVSFADKNRRGFKFADSYGFLMAAFDAYGAFFASPRPDDDGHSVLFYRRFESWAANASWHVQLPSDEDALCVASADHFCAVATSINVLRLYTTAGIPYGSFSLRARVLTMAASGPYLAIVTQVSREACLHCDVYKLPFQRGSPRVAVVASSPLPLSPQADLRWLGFNDAHMLFAMDSVGTLHVLSHGMGDQWTPLASPGPHVFALGFLKDTLLYIPLPEDIDVPRLARKNRPVPSTFVLGRAPERMDKSMPLYPYHKVEHLVWTDSRDVVTEQAGMDKQLLVMLKEACANDMPARALDLAKCFTLEKSHTIAQTIATHFGMRQLGAQLEALYEAFVAQVPEMDAPTYSRTSYAQPTSPPRRQRNFMPPLKQYRPAEDEASIVHEENDLGQDDDDVSADERHVAPPQTPPRAPAPMRTNPFFKGSQDGKRKAAPGSLDTLKSPPPKKKAMGSLFARK